MLKILVVYFFIDHPISPRVNISYILPKDKDRQLDGYIDKADGRTDGHTEKQNRIDATNDL